MVKTSRVITRYYKWLSISIIVIFTLFSLFVVINSIIRNNSIELFNTTYQKEESIKTLHSQYKQSLILFISGNNDVNINDIISNSNRINDDISLLESSDMDIIDISNYHKKIQSNTLLYTEKLTKISLYTKAITCYKAIDIENKNIANNISNCTNMVSDKYSTSFPNTYDYLITYNQYWKLVNQLYSNKITNSTLNNDIKAKYKQLEEKRVLSELEINSFIEKY